MNKGTNGSYMAVYKEVRRNILGVALQGNWRLSIPWFYAEHRRRQAA